jgi:nitroimidazol reductase NimA-like FMN-containing flavoprotein (pyridoxamine 5'-phosphate oxidase superfamily)
MSEVRRKDYEMTERAEMHRLLESVEYGFLGAVRPDGWPIVVPLNYIYLDGRIYFHGAIEGEKMATISRDGRVTFTVVEAFSIVPSYFRDPKLACPATQYYKSVVLRGHARVVEDLEEKARALQTMMEKLQPEGGHVPISAQESIYRKSLKTTGVVAIDIEEMTAKFKFGQNLPSSKREGVAEKLEARGCPIDHATVEAMRRYNR